MCACVCVCVRERETESVCLCMCVRVRGGFHTEMSFLGCIGRLMAGSGLKHVLEVGFA